MLHDKLDFEFTVATHYFSLTEMDELIEKVIPALQMDFAFFVVHAHESRLSINDGRGYTKVYRALLQSAGGVWKSRNPESVTAAGNGKGTGTGTGIRTRT